MSKAIVYPPHMCSASLNHLHAFATSKPHAAPKLCNWLAAWTAEELCRRNANRMIESGECREGTAVMEAAVAPTLPDMTPGELGDALSWTFAALNSIQCPNGDSVEFLERLFTRLLSRAISELHAIDNVFGATWTSPEGTEEIILLEENHAEN